MDMHAQSKMNEIVNYHTYFRDNVCLKRYKVYQLKNIAKKYKLHISGTKTVLIKRIIEFFEKLKKIVKIQSLLRSKIIRNMISLKGPALKNPKICTNETDFYSLEPLNEINYYDFFSFSDDEGFTYGFNINSLILLLKKKSVIHNPYNRKTISYEIIRNISALMKLNKRMHGIRSEALNHDHTVREQTIARMQAIRNKDLDARIHDLFYEIDLLGNYTSSTWLQSLSIEQYVRFLRQMWEIWSVRSNMPVLTKKRICPYFDPFFEGVNNISIRHENIRDIVTLKTTCVTIMENLIYTGINNEYKQLGVILCLTALTTVSDDAREQLPWLYESLS